MKLLKREVIKVNAFVFMSNTYWQRQAEIDKKSSKC